MSEIKTITVGGTTYDLSSGSGLLPHLIISADTETEVTVTKGITEITAEETSEGIYECDVPEYGTYTIEGTVNGNEMTGELVVDDVKIYNFYFITPVPEGATVTPTNDIQTWLHCANITDKIYTTLAEVLADETTFEMLLADNNACDYMARSTDWALNEGAVPVMTSDTTPSGECICDSYTSGENAYKVFDSDYSDNSYWESSSAKTTGAWVGYVFPNEVSVSRVRHRILTSSNCTTKVQYSDDGTTWNDTGTQYTITISSGIMDVNVAYSGTHKYWRVYLVSANNSTKWGTSILQFYSADITTIEDAMSMVGHYDYCSEKLLGNMTWRNAICNSEYFESVLNTKVPAMTSDTAPSGEVIYSSATSSYPAWSVFSASTSDLWLPNSGATNNYVGYDFGVPVIVNKVYYAGHGAPPSSRTFKIQGSNEKTSGYVDLGEFTYTNNPTTATVIFENNTAYRYYRIFCADTLFVSGSWGIHSDVLQFYGRKAVQNEYYPLVPVMTSNTTPSGEVIYSSQYDTTNYNAYKAFDGNSSTTWCGTSSDTSPYIGYKFTSAKRVERVKFTLFKDDESRTVQLQYKDGENWTNIGNAVSISPQVGGSTVIFDVQNAPMSEYWRVQMNGNGGAYEVQFYDKYDTGIIHSASNDTIYYLEEGDPVIVATTNSEGIGEIDFSMLEDNVVLYSSVAKDPTNLSNAYHRAIRITNHQYDGTKEAYLMPDTIRTLYWFGYEDAEGEDISTANGWTWNQTIGNSTHNTNSIQFSTSYGVLNGYGSKNSVDATTIHALYNGTTAYESIYGYVVNSTTKSYVGINYLGDIKTSGLVHATENTSGGGYVFALAQTGMVGALSALWYEKENVA